MLMIGLGWLVAGAASFFTVFRLLNTGISQLVFKFPSAICAVVGLCLVLAGYVARAVFDIADRPS